MVQYLYKLLATTATLAIITVGVGFATKYAFPDLVWGGLIFLACLTALIHLFIFGQKATPNGSIRRLMVGSMVRMFLGIVFLLISLLNIKPVNLFFVVSYCLYFCVFMVFEIWEMRTNLRPDSKPRSKNENA